MDGAIHPHAGARLAGRVSAHRPRPHAGARSDGSAPSARPGRSPPALARLRRHASLAFKRKGVTMHYTDTYTSPHGEMLLVATDAGLSGVYFKGQKYFPERKDWKHAPEHAQLKRA